MISGSTLRLWLTAWARTDLLRRAVFPLALHVLVEEVTASTFEQPRRSIA
jgi:hypothetical protein